MSLCASLAEHSVIEPRRNPAPLIRGVLIVVGIAQFFVAYGVTVSPTQLWLADPIPGMFVLGGIGCLHIAANPRRPSFSSAVGTVVVTTALTRASVSIIDAFHAGGRQTDVLLRSSVWVLAAALALGFWSTGVVPMSVVAWRDARRDGQPD